MSEELIQRNLIEAPERMGAWNFYNIGATSLKALKNAKIIPNRDYEEFESKKPDALIVKKPHVIAAIEYKQPKDLKTKKQIEDAILQEIGTAKALEAKIYIVTDGSKTIWLNPLTGNEIKTENGNTISLVFNKDDIECIKIINKILPSISANNDTILATAIVDPLPLAQQVWQDLWSVSGATPENCLYTFVEIFIFKYLSDLGVLKGIHSFSNLLNQYLTNGENEVLEFYASTVRKKIKELFPLNPKDKTTIINGTIFVSKDDKAVAGYATVFKKILNRFNEFGTLENIDYDFKSKLFETFLKESISKKNWGQFFTPLKVVRSVANMADISPGMKICDPACGVGKFLLEPILHEIHKFFKIENGTLKPQITLIGFDKGFDKDEQKTIILAKANMLIYLSNLIKENADITNQFANLFNETFLLQTNSILGTLANPVKDEYDLILTNPPYVMSGSSNLKEEIAKLDELKRYFSVNAMGIEGLFMEWIIRALKPGGKAFVIVPDGMMNRNNDKRLRDFILDECILDAVISLPLNTFFTTNKKTYIMSLTKKVPTLSGGVSIKERQTTPVFTYLCSEIGETRDVYRFDIEQNDLDNATTLYNMFKGVRGAMPVEDNRCKIVDINKFYDGTHWSVERWWTRDERIELGIEDEKDSVNTDDFASLIGDISNTLLEYQDAIKGSQKKKEKFSVRDVSITDSTYFDVLSSNQLGLTKTQINNLPIGEVPVYSAAKEPILHIEKLSKLPIMADDANPIISFANDGDGSAGRNFVLHTEPFYISASRTAISIKVDTILPMYVLSQIWGMKEKYKFNYGFKANRQNLKSVVIQIPIDNNGGFDIEIQELIANQFSVVNELKFEISKKCEDIALLNVYLDLSNYDIRNFLLSKLLEPVKGKGKYTKKYGDVHKGEYPVYSASANSPLTYIDTFDFEGSYLSWATNGFAGTTTILNGKFSINGDRGLLKPKNKNIDINYIKFVIEPIFRKLAKGRRGDNGKDEFTKLYPSMISDVLIPIPVNTNDELSLSAQKEIAIKYQVIKQTKIEVLMKLRELLKQRVSFN